MAEGHPDWLNREIDHIDDEAITAAPHSA